MGLNRQASRLALRDADEDVTRFLGSLRAEVNVRRRIRPDKPKDDNILFDIPSGLWRAILRQNFLVHHQHPTAITAMDPRMDTLSCSSHSNKAG